MRISSINTSQSLVGLLIEQIKHDILFSVLLPDSYLSTALLQKQYGASIKHLHEALNALMGEQLIYVHEHQFRVANPLSGDTSRRLDARVAIANQGLACSIANGNIHWQAIVVSSQQNFLQSIQRTEQKDAGYADELEAANRHFHSSLMIPCDNQALIKQHEILYQKGLRFRLSKIKGNKIDLTLLKKTLNSLVDSILECNIHQSQQLLEQLIRI